MTVYGIKNCNTVKKALDWLQRHKVAYEFHDYKTRGITQAKLRNWSKQVGLEDLVNRKGTTWRQLDDATRAAITTQASAIALMEEKPTVIRRPLIEDDGNVLLVGFDESAYSEQFGN